MVFTLLKRLQEKALERALIGDHTVKWILNHHGSEITRYESDIERVLAQNEVIQNAFKDTVQDYLLNHLPKHISYLQVHAPTEAPSFKSQVDRFRATFIENFGDEGLTHQYTKQH